MSIGPVVGLIDVGLWALESRLDTPATARAGLAALTGSRVTIGTQDEAS